MYYALRILDVLKYKNPLVYTGDKSHNFSANHLHFIVEIELVS